MIVVAMRNARSAWRRAFAFIAAGLLLSACGGSGHPAHWLRISDGSGDLTSLDPHLTAGASMDDIGQLTLAYFIRYGRGGRPIAELITEIPSKANGGVSPDGRTITWHLRRGVRWSDGAPFDARDVVFSTRAVLNPKNDEIGGTEGWDRIERIETPDPYTVVYRLRQPYAALIPMAFGTVGGGPSLLPQHLLARLPDINHAPYNALPVGIGPFRITAWRRGDAIEMEANPYYWRGRPKLSRITYQIIPSRETLASRMRSGETDLWPRVPPTYAEGFVAAPGLRLERGPSLRTTHLDFMLAPGSIADRAVRRAVRLAIDRRALIRTVEHGQGFVTDDIVWPPAPVVRDDPNAVTADPARARALLLADGWAPAADGIRTRGGRRLALRLAYQAGSPDIDTYVEVIRAGLRAVGVELDARTYTHALLFAPQDMGGVLANGRFDATIYSSTIVSLPDFASNFACAQAPPHGENYMRWCDPRVDQILAGMRGSYERAEILRSFRKLDAIFVDEAPSIQLFVWRGNVLANDRLRGYHDNILTSFDEMMDVDI
jgi:peptide/nickel transport system substrate-binding protein